MCIEKVSRIGFDRRKINCKSIIDFFKIFEPGANRQIYVARRSLIEVRHQSHAAGGGVSKFVCRADAVNVGERLFKLIAGYFSSDFT